MPEHTIDALCQRSDAIAREKGWVKDTDERPYHTAFILQVSELSEALEEYRNNKKVGEIYYEYKSEDGTTLYASGLKACADISKFKPCGIPIELADFVIRVCQRCGTDKRGQELAGAYVRAAVRTRHYYPDFEKMLAEVHLKAALAYADWNVGFASNWNAGLASKSMALLGDALVLVFAFCRENEIDLWEAIDVKEAYNRTRSHRHGNKKI